MPAGRLTPVAFIAAAGAIAAFCQPPACSTCHPKIAEAYSRSGMGRSMHSATADVMPPAFRRATYYHKASDRHYTVLQRAGQFYQRRHQIGPLGTEINVLEREIHFVVGSGKHAKSFLHRSAAGRIYELPLAWYAERGGMWGMNPGYDHPNHPDFRREVSPECIACHSAYPAAAQLPGGIDCQRCHGPGRNHIEAVRAGDPAKVRASIVNPARLPSALQLDVCMQCHLETTSAPLPALIVREGRGAFSFQPGEPLSSFALHFDHAPGTARDDKFEIASHAYRLRKSACFEKSNGKLTCTTCHNPHQPADRESALRACRDCHVQLHTREPDCLGCHMPRRRTEDVVHVTMTDHYIQRHKPAGDLLAPRSESPSTDESAYHGPVVPYYPQELPDSAESALYLALAQVKQFSNLPEGVPRLAQLIDEHRPASASFYIALAAAYQKLGQWPEAIRRYQEALQRAPRLSPARLGLAQVLSRSGQQEQAADLLTDTVVKDANDSAAWNGLGLVRLRQGKPVDAVAAFQKAIVAEPEYPEAFNNLGGALVQSGNPAAAVPMYRESIRLQPDLASAHLNLAKLLGPGVERDYHFRKAIQHRPGFAAFHYDYGLALAAEKRHAQAASEFETATRLDPAMAEAHSSLGDVLASQGNAAQAILSYRRALALRPDLAPARTGLQKLGASPQ